MPGHLHAAFSRVYLLTLKCIRGRDKPWSFLSPLPHQQHSRSPSPHPPLNTSTHTPLHCLPLSVISLSFSKAAFPSNLHLSPSSPFLRLSFFSCAALSLSFSLSLSLSRSHSPPHCPPLPCAPVIHLSVG